MPSLPVVSEGWATCVRCGLYLVSEGDARLALLLREPQIRQIPRDRGVDVAERGSCLLVDADFRRCEAATTALVDEDPDGTVL